MTTASRKGASVLTQQELNEMRERANLIEKCTFFSIAANPNESRDA